MCANAEGTVLTFDFCRGTKATRSFTYQPERDDTKHSVLVRTACQFLRVYWARAVQPS